jgi:signal transduction histidine kinase
LNLKYFIVLGISLSGLLCLKAQQKELSVNSVIEMMKSSNDDDYTVQEKIDYAKAAVSLAKSIDNDSICLKALGNLADLTLRNGDFVTSKATNRKIIELSNKVHDSLGLGLAHYALGYTFAAEEQNDSSYYHFYRAANIFDNINNRVQLSYVLGSISTLQVQAKDFFGAEENAVKGLKIIQNVEETNEILDQKWILYNTLGNIASSLNNYDKALEYHKQALRIARQMAEDFNNELYSLNNMANVKRKQTKYAESKDIFEEIIKTERLRDEDPSFYALVSENLAYTRYLSEDYVTDDIKTLFQTSYKICDSLEDEYTKAGAAISWAKFEKGIGDLEEAKKRAYEAYILSKRVASNDVLQEAMLLLSELNEGEQGKVFLNEHIQLTDSLLQVERSVRNKFARIELETEQLEAENEQISRENVYLLVLSAGLLLTAILVYVVISQRAKNRKLRLIQVQQKANEDIYNLMLLQQDKVEEARTSEKRRISEELHDGVLGRLFGTRLSLDSINFKEGKDAIATRANYIAQLKTIEEDIRKISHELNTDFVTGTGFMDIVSELIDTQAKAYGLESEFSFTDDISWDRVSNKIKINMYRIIQESMQNIYKHAQAQQIKIAISLENDDICLMISDDGQGFDTSRNRKGIGLKNMQSRVADISGNIDFESATGQGTVVTVKIPYTIQQI